MGWRSVASRGRRSVGPWTGVARVSAWVPGQQATNSRLRTGRRGGGGEERGRGGGEECGRGVRSGGRGGGVG